MTDTDKDEDTQITKIPLTTNEDDVLSVKLRVSCSTNRSQRQTFYGDGIYREGFNFAENNLCEKYFSKNILRKNNLSETFICRKLFRKKRDILFYIVYTLDSAIYSIIKNVDHNSKALTQITSFGCGCECAYVCTRKIFKKIFLGQ